MEWKFNVTAEMSGVDLSLCDCECNNKKAVLSQRCPRDAQSDNMHMV